MYRTLELISPSALRPGDVLLSHGGGALRPIWSWVRLLYGRDPTYAAYWDGQVAIEVGESGARVRRIHDHIDEHEHTDVYRFHKDGIGFGGNGFDPAPLHKRMRSLLAEPYASRPLAMLALVLARRGPCLPAAERQTFLRSPVARALEAELKDWERTGERPTIGSERFACSFHDATPDCRFGLHPPTLASAWDPRFAPDLWSSPDDAGLLASLGSPEPDGCESLIARCTRIFAVPRRDRSPHLAAAPLPELDPWPHTAHACCAGAVHPLTARTLPRDIARSPDLRRIGRLR